NRQAKIGFPITPRRWRQKPIDWPVCSPRSGVFGIVPARQYRRMEPHSVRSCSGGTEHASILRVYHMAKVTYKSAGVDLDVYEESMSRLPRLMHRTFSPRVMKLDGGFAGLFQLDFASRLFARNYQDPVLVSCTDGVGTKLKVAQMIGRHDTVGIDLVAMSVNDALCC